MIEFVLNNSLIRTVAVPGMPLLDFIRLEMGLTGTKTGCREGDCGACTVLKGELSEGRMEYHAIVSCLTPLGRVQGKHIVTLEGLNREVLSPVQKMIVDHSATQCGFCTPGIVVSLSGFLMSGDFSDRHNIVTSIDGNICRCTGYKSIEKAVLALFDSIPAEGRNNIQWLVSHNYIPGYFDRIPEMLGQIGKPAPTSVRNGLIIGGGTDLMVQRADEIRNHDLVYSGNFPDQYKIRIDGEKCTIGASVTVSQLYESEALNALFPRLKAYLKLVSSTPVRNMATLAGNIVNASPIADLVVFFLGLDATIVLQDSSGRTRELKMNQFYTGYKKMDKKPDEVIDELFFMIPPSGFRFNFEKVSKRQHLDIASVNSALLITLTEKCIREFHFSAGGVAPVPLYFSKTCRYMKGKNLDADTLSHAASLIQTEVAPISDIRGSAVYKRLLLRQLFFAHFIELFPGLVSTEMIKMSDKGYEEH